MDKSILTIFCEGQAMGSSNKAFNVIRTQELMREWTLSFEIPNSEAVQPYCVAGNYVYYGGWQYIIVRYTIDDGVKNTTQCDCEHVSYLLNNYVIHPGYTKTGNLDVVMNDILTVSGAYVNTFFATNISTKGSKVFTYSGTNDITVKALLIKLASAYGAEFLMQTDYTIMFADHIGTNNGKVFTFGKDLINCQYSKDKTTNPTTESYTLEIINLQRFSGYLSTDVFDVGDTVNINSKTIKAAGLRLTTYTYCYDDPTQDSCGIGSFVPDTSDTITTLTYGQNLPIIYPF